MDIQENIVNKVAQSGLVTLDPAAFYPAGERVIYDIKDNLYMELILREKDFREFVKTHDWTQYEGKNVAITCTADAIVPAWAYMLIANRLAPYAREVVFGDAAADGTVPCLRRTGCGAGGHRRVHGAWRHPQWRHPQRPWI